MDKDFKLEKQKFIENYSLARPIMKNTKCCPKCQSHNIVPLLMMHTAI